MPEMCSGKSLNSGKAAKIIIRCRPEGLFMSWYDDVDSPFSVKANLGPVAEEQIPYLKAAYTAKKPRLVYDDD